MKPLGKARLAASETGSRFVLQLLAIMFLVEFVKGALLVSVLPLYLDNVLRFSGFLIGLTFALQYMGDNLFRSPIGWAIDRIGYKPVMFAGVLLTMTSVSLLKWSSDPFWVVAACALLGVGTSPLWPCVMTAATSRGGEKAQSTVISTIYLAWFSGVGIGPIVINFFEDVRYETPLNILLAMSAAGIVLAMTLPRGERSSDRADGQPEQAGPAPVGRGRIGRIKAYFAEAHAALTVRPIFYPALFLQTFALGLLIPVLTIYAREVLHFTAKQYSLLLLIGGAVTALLMVPVGRMCDRWGIMRFSSAGFLLSGGALLLFTLGRDFVYVVAMVVLLGTGYALLIPAWNALVATAVPKEKRGAIWGFFLTIEGLGTVSGSVASGLLRDWAGHEAPFIVSGTVLLVLFVAQLFIFPRRLLTS